MQIALGEKAQGKMHNVHIFNNLHFTPSVSLYPFVTKEPPILTGVDADRYLGDEGRIVAYFCLLNDKISRLEVTNSLWKSIRDNFPDGKRFRSYPSIKIGRFAVSKDYRGHQIGSELLSTIKYLLGKGQNLSAFRFITVDAYLSAIPFTKRTVSWF